jgi:hypothetical protein
VHQECDRARVDQQPEHVRRRRAVVGGGVEECQHESDDGEDEVYAAGQLVVYYEAGAEDKPDELSAGEAVSAGRAKRVQIGAHD